MIRHRSLPAPRRDYLVMKKTRGIHGGRRVAARGLLNHTCCRFFEKSGGFCRRNSKLAQFGNVTILQGDSPSTPTTLELKCIKTTVGKPTPTEISSYNASFSGYGIRTKTVNAMLLFYCKTKSNSIQKTRQSSGC